MVITVEQKLIPFEMVLQSRKVGHVEFERVGRDGNISPGNPDGNVSKQRVVERRSRAWCAFTQGGGEIKVDERGLDVCWIISEASDAYVLTAQISVVDSRLVCVRQLHKHVVENLHVLLLAFG